MKDHFYSRNRQVDQRFRDQRASRDPVNKVIYKKKDNEQISRQSQLMRASFQNMQNSWQKDLKTNSNHHQIIKQIITSTNEEKPGKKSNVFESSKVKNYYPALSLTTNPTALNQKKSDYQYPRKETAKFQPFQKPILDLEANDKKIISRSVPRSPLKPREPSHEPNAKKKEETAAPFISGKRIGTNPRKIINKRGR